MMTKQIIEQQNAVVHRMVAKQVMHYVAPIIFGLAPGPDAEGSKTQNGSCSLVEIDGRRFIVTNDHVLRGFEDLQTHPRARLQIGDAEPISPRVIDRNEKLDLAILDATGLLPEQVQERGNHIPFWPIRPAHWPMARVQRGESICFGGWPQKYRTGSHGERIVTSASWSLSATEVTEVGDDRFICVFNRESWVESFGEIAGGSKMQELGGLSGCPAFVHRGLSFEFVGVLFEYSPLYDTMFFAHADLIGVDGKLRSGDR